MASPTKITDNKRAYKKSKLEKKRSKKVKKTLSKLKKSGAIL